MPEENIKTDHAHSMPAWLAFSFHFCHLGGLLSINSRMVLTTLYVTSSTPSSGANCTVTSACHKHKRWGRDRPVHWRKEGSRYTKRGRHNDFQHPPQKTACALSKWTCTAVVSLSDAVAVVGAKHSTTRQQFLSAQKRNSMRTKRLADHPWSALPGPTSCIKPSWQGVRSISRPSSFQASPPCHRRQRQQSGLYKGADFSVPTRHPSKHVAPLEPSTNRSMPTRLHTFISFRK